MCVMRMRQEMVKMHRLNINLYVMRMSKRRLQKLKKDASAYDRDAWDQLVLCPSSVCALESPKDGFFYLFFVFFLFVCLFFRHTVYW